MLATRAAAHCVPVDEAGRTAPPSLASLLRPEPAERFPGFGRPILAPILGEVVQVHDAAPDHRAFRGGQSVRVGETLGRCGNSGNSTEPQVRLRAMDRLDVLHAVAVPLTFRGRLPRNGEIIEARQQRSRSRGGHDGAPRSP